MNFKIIIIYISIIFLSGCGSTRMNISKDYFTEQVYKINFYELADEKLNSFFPTISMCFDMEEEIFSTEFNSICLECGERELEFMPSMMSEKDITSFKNSFSRCVSVKLLKTFEGNFTFDKSPENITLCKKIYDEIQKFK